MANAVSRIPLSGSTQGKLIKVAATATPGTTIHTTGTSATVIDAITIYCVNSDTTARKLTIEWGGTTSPDDTIEVTIPAESGHMLVIPALPLLGNGSVALVVKAFAASANVLLIGGFVDRVTP
jgi:hypothetical protein